MFRKITTIVSHTLYVLVVLSVLVVALLFVGTKVDLLGYEVKIVQSGSMEPSIKTGGIVIIAPRAQYQVGDVVTYGRDSRGSIPVTHRIIAEHADGRITTYTTKGDANEDPDPRIVSVSSIIGKVVLTVPYVGYIIEFARTPLGFALFIGIPALVIVLDELATIVWEVRKYCSRKKKTRAATPMSTLKTSHNHSAQAVTSTHTVPKSDIVQMADVPTKLTVRSTSLPNSSS